MRVQISVIGLGQVGTSIGLALGERKGDIWRVGNDREIEVARAAQKLGAFDQVVHNLPAAVEKADVVVLAVPVDDIRPTLEVIAADLKPGAVVIDTSPVKSGVMEWAARLIPAERHFVTLTPIVNAAYLQEMAQGVQAAHADLFRGGLMIITNPPGADAEAIKLAADLANLLGGTPFFADPVESDGLLAASHQLPRLLAAALVNATIDQPGWGEGRKLAGRAYAIGTLLALEPDEMKEFGQAVLLNRQNMLRVLDDLKEELDRLCQAIADEDAAGLANLLNHAREGRQAWWKARLTGQWGGNEKENPLPTSSEIFSWLLMGQGKRKKPDSQ